MKREVASRHVIAVMVDEPQGGHLGGAVAAPIFKQIAEQALQDSLKGKTVAELVEETKSSG